MPSSVLPSSGDGAWQRTRFPQGQVASTKPSRPLHENFVSFSGTTRFISLGVLEAFHEIVEARDDQADRAAHDLGLRAAARQVALGAPEIHPHVLEAREEVGIARAADAGDVEERRKPLVVDDDVEVLEVDDVADDVRVAVVLLDLLGGVHTASIGWGYPENAVTSAQLKKTKKAMDPATASQKSGD